MTAQDKCFLLIIPFSNKEQAERESNNKAISHYARNLLEVNDDFYEDILNRYKKRK